jgi:hypothetical protein
VLLYSSEQKFPLPIVKDAGGVQIKNVKLRVKQSRYRPGVAQRVPGS